MSTVKPRLYTIEELQELLHISRPTVYRLMAQGRLPSVKLGSRRMFRPEDVEALLEEEARRSISTVR